VLVSKKGNKKKKSKNKANSETSKGLEVTIKGAANDDDAGDNEAEDIESSTVVRRHLSQSPPLCQALTLPKLQSTPQIERFSENAGQTTNGHAKSPVKSKMESPVSAAAAKEILEDSMESVGSDTTDASSRLEAMSANREALRAEVEKLRKALEDIRATHTEEINTIRTELEESEAAKEQAQNQYQNLLGRVNTIKSTLGERLQADRQELAEATDKIEELEGENEALRNNNAETEKQIEELEKEAREAQRELSSLRNRHNLSQQNWANEREDLLAQTRQLREEAEAAKEAMGDWEVLAMEERSIREGLADRVAELEDQLSSQREGFERAASERDSQSQVVDGLQRALQDIQEARRVELREMVESTQTQVEALNKLVAEAEARADLAETAKKALEVELERAAPFEKEVKEKNLLIGKLRHEAIILNDHLAKALRFLKKAKPEDNIDRSVISYVQCSIPILPSFFT
jgi:chromosome segregation ATPase